MRLDVHSPAWSCASQGHVDHTRRPAGRQSRLQRACSLLRSQRSDRPQCENAGTPPAWPPARRSIPNGPPLDVQSVCLFGVPRPGPLVSRVTLPITYRPENTTALEINLPHEVHQNEQVTVELTFTMRLPQRQGRWGQWEGVHVPRTVAPCPGLLRRYKAGNRRRSFRGTCRFSTRPGSTRPSDAAAQRKTRRQRHRRGREGRRRRLEDNRRRGSGRAQILPFISSATSRSSRRRSATSVSIRSRFPKTNFTPGR